MARKADPQDPGPLPAETKRTRRPALTLSDRAAELVRKTAAYAGVSVELVKGIISGKWTSAGDETDQWSLDRLVECFCDDITKAADKDRAKERASIFAKEESDAPREG